MLLFAGALGFYSAIKYRRNAAIRQASRLLKAPETKVTFLEGWTNAEIGAYLEKNGVVKAGVFLALTENFDASAYTALSGKPKNAGLQGFIFPDTYFIPQSAPSSANISEIIIKKALNNFTTKFTTEMQAQAEAKGMSIFQILTLASIIEKETGRAAITPEQKQSLDDERKIISGIFYNRLKDGVPLQSDATVNFVTKKNLASPDITDTEVDSPYNTYKYAGLPPGPICNPSLSSILAALYPTASDFMYFLHDQKTGQVYYAKTYEEHLKNKQKYLR
jgi:UPF0755 protein